jgi:hypothetical protein
MAKETQSNLMFREKDIPEKYGTDDKKLDFLVKSVDEIFSSLSTAEGNATENRIRIGQRLRVTKQVLKRSKKKFGAYIEEHLPYVQRSAQRWMKLAKHVRLDEHHSLSLLGDVRLTNLIRIAKGEPLHQYLKNNDVDMKFNVNDNFEVSKFREEVQALIKDNLPSSETSLDKALSNLQKTLRMNLDKIEPFCKRNSVTIDPDLLQKTIEEAEELVSNLKVFRRYQADKEKLK